LARHDCSDSSPSPSSLACGVDVAEPHHTHPTISMTATGVIGVKHGHPFARLG
jgi:hypothetical protein